MLIRAHLSEVGFLGRFMDRLAFAVSVFHAFVHEWACQLLYHPRKCKGFGFTNGEGCKRFWHSISHLIANLQICGVSCKLILQIHYLTMVS
ncbi:hypothetical protein B0H17DRAFT_967487 [Mycena rosella]|uniref:Uncharacterized protein n=1 Tax=Mycena rosella TaxID=1033263 RepID=A0AAD7F842_MYCRO|nr:hypothetical protein B0H17DRAFT_967487 [Mycena rosella]